MLRFRSASQSGWFAATLAVAMLAASSVGATQIITYQPAEANSSDTFIYEFLKSTNFNIPGFDNILAAANAGPVSTPPDPANHNVRSLLQFDLSGIAATAPILHAEIGLRIIDGTTIGFPFANPSPTSPIDIDLYNPSGAWNESTVTWGTGIVPTGSPLASSTNVNGINQTLTFDVTTAAQAWHANAANNNGVEIVQRNPVLSGSGASTLAVAAVFLSSNGPLTDPNLRPYLKVTIPEPSTIVMGLVGLPLIGLAVYRRRLAARKAG